MSRERLALPAELLLARHGQSAGNVARDLAEASGRAMIDIAIRDMDVPLSPLGERQAAALGRWLGALPRESRPTLIDTSPYLRARATATIARDRMGVAEVGIVADERLREREFGIVDRLTQLGIQEKYPEQAEFHARLRKFYYRPPGGESWCDVILRLRSLLDTLRENGGDRVLVVCHSVVVLCFRYILEQLSEAQILAIDRESEIANCSVTVYARESREARGALALRTFNFVAPLEEAGEKVTRRTDVSHAP